MPITRYFVERLTAHSDAWMIRFDDEEYGPFRNQSEAVRFAIDAAEKLNEHCEKGQVVVIGPTRTSSAAGHGEFGGAVGESVTLLGRADEMIESNLLVGRRV